jgi:hypothetical protein
MDAAKSASLDPAKESGIGLAFPGENKVRWIDLILRQIHSYLQGELGTHFLTKALFIT